MLTNFYDLTYEQLESLLKDHGFERFRADQLYRWVYGRRQTDFAQMTNMSKSVRDKLPEILRFELPKVVTHLKSSDGTEKFLFEVGGGDTVESVLIPADDRLTLCVSSEVGCNMGCRFCYTGKQKMKRRLTTAEIVGQYLTALDSLRASDNSAANENLAPRRITNIVFMGMGEPLDNPDAVFSSIEILHSPLGCNLSKKKITVSTSGIVPLIPRITASGARLAVSLNGVNDDVRSKVMPINKRWPIDELLESCREHCRATGDRVTLEYVLLKDVTDSLDDARALHRLTRDVPCKINIIPFNEHPGSGFERPDERQIVKFQNELIRLGSHVLRRKTMGRDIYAACGQLRTVAEKRRPAESHV